MAVHWKHIVPRLLSVYKANSFNHTTKLKCTVAMKICALRHPFFSFFFFIMFIQSFYFMWYVYVIFIAPSKKKLKQTQHNQRINQNKTKYKKLSRNKNLVRKKVSDLNCFVSCSGIIIIMIMSVCVCAIQIGIIVG